MKNEFGNLRQDLPLEDLWPLIEEVFAKGGRVRLFPRGSSMLPLIRPGVDSVLLEKPTQLLRHDILLYRRKNGQFVLHRLMKKDQDRLTMCGDNQHYLEKDVSAECILARVCGIYFDENYMPIESKKLRIYAKKRAFSRPFRHLASGAARRLHLSKK